jgi:hypothetical protein
MFTVPELLLFPLFRKYLLIPYMHSSMAARITCVRGQPHRSCWTPDCRLLPLVVFYLLPLPLKKTTDLLGLQSNPPRVPLFRQCTFPYWVDTYGGKVLGSPHVPMTLAVTLSNDTSTSLRIIPYVHHGVIRTYQKSHLLPVTARALLILQHPFFFPFSPSNTTKSGGEYLRFNSNVPSIALTWEKDILYPFVLLLSSISA